MAEYNYEKYREYISSSKWLERKSKFVVSMVKSKKPIRCFDCKCKNWLQLHHTSYKNLYKEKDEDLVLLCKQCHESRHNIKDSNQMDEELWKELFRVFGFNQG
jgi:RNase P subunit RPR2